MSRVYVLLGRRLLIVAWLITGITTVPFFDNHIPDNTDRWSALQSGVHTVFTPDLPGEYSRPFHDINPWHFSHLSQRAVNSPEVGIALMNDSSEDEKAKQLYVLYVPYHPPNPLLVRWPLECSGTFHKFSLAFPASRAPPHVAHA
jgi:hypothetical protein